MRASILLTLVAAAALGGCTTGVSPNGDLADAEASASANGIVVVAGTVTGDQARAEAVARFVKMKSGAVDDDALRGLGAIVDFPTLGTCAAAPSRQGAMRAMALVDVGSVTLEAAGTRTSLLARELPDVADLVSGVVYSARPQGGALPSLPSRGNYVVRVAGSAELDVAPFVAQAVAPGEPADVRVSGQDARLATSVALVAGAPVDVTWDASNVGDVIYVDVTDASGGSTVSRCAFVDTGRAAIADSAFASLDEGVLAVHRLHREPFRAHGVDPGEIRFDFARVVPFTRR